ncbi:hypothetical protein Q8A67_010875 [Cirrhinus molitorella]|uniref:Uncharacterized protein n=1 Tax=Cirrhinus molitorella TaxID=172907 RepID=A0AA88PT60_9TELE|nr:hypothetical protein Q8A67_010875 [Cirrhinus molitorella]
MSSELGQVFVEVYVNRVFYCTESYWAPDEQDVELEDDFKDAISEFVSLVSEELTDPAGPSEEEIDQDGTDASSETSKENIPIDYAKVRKTVGAFFQKRYGISAQPDSDDPLSLTSEPELDPVNPEEWCIPGEPEPVSSEGFVDDISDAISELKNQMLVYEDLTDPEGPSVEVGGSSSGNVQSGTDASSETESTKQHYTDMETEMSFKSNY